MDSFSLKDKNVAAVVEFNIGRIERLVFGEQNRLPIITKWERCADNCHNQFALGGNKSSNTPLAYIIRVPGAHEYICRANRFDYVSTQANRFFSFSPGIVLGGICAHEVRHRIQRTIGSIDEEFSSKNISNVSYLIRLNQFIERVMRETGTWETDPSHDFDAMVIEALVMNALRLKIDSPNYIRQLMLATPKKLPELFKFNTGLLTA